MSKTIRYVGQRDNFRCGPIVIVNALKWAGVPKSFKNLKKSLDLLCRCYGKGSKVRGTKHKYLHAILKLVMPPNIKVAYQESPTLKDLDKIAKDKNQAAIITFAYPDENISHLFLLTDGDGKNYTAVNLYTHEAPVVSITRDRLKKVISRRSRLHCWKLTKSP